jgi:hypothetical protein
VPDPEKLLATIRQATEHVNNQSGRVGKYVELSGCEEVFVVGDLHGHLANFKKVLHYSKLSVNPARHVVLQELVHGPFRAADGGGELSHRLVDVVCAYICQYPGRVHYLVGNHEVAQWTGREIAKNNENLNDLFIAGVQTSYGEAAEEILRAYDELFQSLPVAIRLPNRVFLSHSLPGMRRLETWTLDQLKKDSFAVEDHKLGGCVHAVVWGRETEEATAKKYLELVDADLLVSGHIPNEQGYAVPNPYQVILDGKDENAQGLLIPTNEPLTQEQLLKGLVKFSELPA